MGLRTKNIRHSYIHMGAQQSAVQQPARDNRRVNTPNAKGEAPSQLRMLCLHGSSSNSDITELQMLSLRLRERGIDCDYLHAPFSVNSPQSSSMSLFSEGPWYTWCNVGPSHMLGIRSVPPYEYNEGCRSIMEHVQAHGPYDGLFGFSLGAAMAVLASSPTVWRGIHGYEACPWRYLVLCNAALPWLVTSARVQLPSGETVMVDPDIKAHVSTLHLIGAQDWFANDSRRLAAMFQPEGPARVSRMFEHSGGHEVPMAIVNEVGFGEVMDEFFAAVAAGTCA